MNINGVNSLACTSKTPRDLKKSVKIYPLAHAHVIRDLVPDLTHVYRQYASIKPYLQQKEELIDRFDGDKENVQSKERRAELDGLYECILCFCCEYSCPSYCKYLLFLRYLL
jgi:succinate dehydrogenase/fumarate reductase iron-sulfur protein